MPVDLEAFSRLIELLYESLACPDRWQDFLSEVARQIRCDKAAVVFHDRKNQTPAMSFYAGLSDAAMRDYNSYYGSRNPAALPILQAAVQKGAWHGLVRSVVDERAYKKSEYYGGWGWQNGVYHAVVGVASDKEQSVTSLSVMRSQSAGELDQDAVDLMQRLMPHLKLAFQVHKKMETLRACADGAKVALDKLETGVIGVDREGRVTLMNRRAESILKKGKGITLRQGLLTTTDPRQSVRLEQLVRSATMTGAGLGSDSGGAILVDRTDMLRPLPVTVAPFRSSHLLSDEQPCALVFVTDPAEEPGSRATLLATLFGMTPAECRLADLLLEDLHLNAVAERMHIAVGTARFMLKNIFHKTATHSQSQLIRLLTRLPGEASPRPNHKA